MTIYYVRSPQTGQTTPGSGTYRGIWIASTAFVSGDRVFPSNGIREHNCFECTTGGTSGSGAEPTWQAATTSDNTVTWTTRTTTTWNNAHIKLAAIASADVAGDTIYVRNDHSESTAGAVSLSWAGTVADPTRIICVSDSNEPPTTIATGAVVATTGASNIVTNTGSGSVYYYGINFVAGDSTNNASITSTSNSSALYFDTCTFELRGTGTSSRILSLQTTSECVAKNCTFKFASTSQAIGSNAAPVFLTLDGCTWSSSGSDPSVLFTLGSNSTALIRKCDMSNGSSSLNFNNNSSNNVSFEAINCKLPGSWSGSITSVGTVPFGCNYRLFNSDSSDTNYRLEVKTPFGTVTHETTIKRTGGASDGTTGLSWKMVSNADAEWSHQTLDTPEMVRWNEKTGVSVTATIEIVHDSVTNLTDKEIWLEAMYLGTSGYPLGSTVSDAAANYLSSGADQTASTETWTTTGLTNPNKQKLSVTFTPQEKGTIRCVVKLAKASKTVYVDPKLNVTY